MIFPINIEIVVNFSDGEIKKFNVFSKNTVGKIISTVINLSETKYILCFKQNNGSFIRALTNSLPLTFQQWKSEELYLLRRITPDDLPLLNNPINIISFYQECKQAISFHLSIYPVETFVHLAILQYIKEGGNPMAFSIQRLKLYLPQFLKVDETIEQIGSDIIKNYYNLNC